MTSGRGKEDRSGRRILIVGTGGQGVLTAARLLCDTLVEEGHEVVSGQLHGMAQRGGSVQASVMVDCGISPVIPSGGANCVLGFEPVETARALGFMSSHTVVYMNTSPVIPYILGQRSALKQADAEYPEVEELARCIRDVTSHLFLFDATELAIEAGSVKALNMVMLGCLLGFGSLPCTPDRFWDAVARTMPGRLAKTNSGAFSRGVELGKNFQHAEMTQ